MTFEVELEDETADKEKLTSELATSIQQQCRLKADRIEFVPGGTIPKEGKTIVDKRTWE